MANKFEFYDEWLPEGYGFTPENPWNPAHDRQERYPRTEADVQAAEKTPVAEVDAALRAMLEQSLGEDTPRAIDK